MNDALFNPQWYRVSQLCPRIRPGVDYVQHVYRKHPWYLIKGSSYSSTIRINASAHTLMQQFDGSTHVDEVWQRALVELGDDAPTQGEIIQLLVKLFDADVIDFEQSSDLDQLFENRKDAKRSDQKTRYGNPLFMRFKLFNPNALATALLPYTKGLFTRSAFFAWFGLMVAALVAASYSFDALAHAFSADMATRRNLIILWCVFPVMKLIHELAHALAIRRFGGRVDECGLALLVLIPVPYVDGSDSVRFSSKFQRIAVAGAGILVETTLAALGLAVWLLVEPGLVKEVALVVAVTGSVSSVLFNGNPLLKFDAYYVLSDYLEIPNLSSRSKQYPLYLIKRYLLGLDAHTPATAAGERRWLIGYGVASGMYRLVLTVVICLYVASHYFFIGVAIALWAASVQLIKPVFDGLRFLSVDDEVRRNRFRVNSVVGSALLVAGFALFVLQIPHVTSVRGVVWPEDQAVVRAGTDCFVRSVAVTNGEVVEPGTALVDCEDQQAQAKLEVLRADHLIARATLDATRDRADREVLATRLESTAELLDKAEQRNRRLNVISSAGGEVYIPGAESLEGRFIQQGELVAYILAEDRIRIRTLLDQERFELVENGVQAVDVRLLDGSEQSAPTHIIRKVPAATHQLSIAALGETGGGTLREHQNADGNAELVDAAFELELSLPDVFGSALIGRPVELRFLHGSATPATILYRELQLLLLSKFNV